MWNISRILNLRVYYRNIVRTTWLSYGVTNRIGNYQIHLTSNLVKEIINMIKSIRIIISIAMISFFAQSVIAEVSTIEMPELIPKDMSIISTLENFITDRSENYPDVKCFLLTIVNGASYEGFYQFNKKTLGITKRDSIVNDSTTYLTIAQMNPEKDVYINNNIGYINIGEYIFILRNIIVDQFPLETYFLETTKKCRFRIKEEVIKPMKRVDDSFLIFYFLDGKFYQQIPPEYF